MENPSQNWSSTQTYKSTSYICGLRETSPDATNALKTSYTLDSILNSVLSVSAILGNCLILLAVRKSRTLHAPSKALFTNLALTDLGVGLIVQPLLVLDTTSFLKENCRALQVVRPLYNLTSGLLSATSFLTVTAISVDQFLAVHLCMSYCSTVTLRRVIKVMVLLWMTGAAWASTIFWNFKIYLYTATVLVCACLATSSIAYYKIYRILRRQQMRVYSHTQATGRPQIVNVLNLARHRKFISGMFYVNLLLYACYLPTIPCMIAKASREFDTQVQQAYIFTRTIVFMSSSLNPLIVCWRIRDVRQAAWGILKGVRHPFS